VQVSHQPSGFLIRTVSAPTAVNSPLLCPSFLSHRTRGYWTKVQ